MQTQKQKEKDLWRFVIEETQRLLDFSDFSRDLWFKETELELLSDNKAYISVSVNYKRNVIDGKYKETIATAFKNLLNKEITPVFISTEEKTFEEQIVEILENNNNSQENKSSSYSEAYSENTNQVQNKKDKLFEPEHGILREYTFENFIVGSTNKFAHATCSAMAKDPACAYNPLFIYGPPGLGKTHLLNAMIREVSLRRPEAKIIYVKCEDFTTELIAAITRNATVSFKEKYRSADLLLVDDIQFISGKKSVQEEYFHTFNTLFEAGKQIVMTSDRPPKAIAELDERLRSRFEMRVMADIQPPDLELRIAIIKHKSQLMKIEIPNDVLLFLGEAITENIRQIEGVITKLNAISFLKDEEINLEMAKTVVNEVTNSTGKPKLSPNDIIAKVAEAYDLTTEDLLGKKQSQNIANPRHIAIFLIRDMLSLSLNDIGKIFGRNHTTIMSSEAKINNLMKDSPDFSEKLEQLKNDIKAK